MHMIWLAILVTLVFLTLFPVILIKFISFCTINMIPPSLTTNKQQLFVLLFVIINSHYLLFIKLIPSLITCTQSNNTGAPRSLLTFLILLFFFKSLMFYK